jgi:hypothetical protein
MHIGDTDPITAITLLNCFDEMVGCSEPFPSIKPPGDESTLAWRYKWDQIQSLFRAFGLDGEAFGGGYFLPPSGDRYASVVAKLPADIPITHHDLAFTFRFLREYRYKVRRAAEIPNFLSCPRLLWRIVQHELQAASDAARDSLRPIEEILSLLIDPEGRAFTVDQLTADYGYPSGMYRGLVMRDQKRAWAAVWRRDRSKETGNDR